MSAPPTCSWASCLRPGTEPQIDRAGGEWARLCRDHAEELDRAIAGGDPKTLMGAWVKAQGGAKAAADRALGKKGPR